MNRIRFLVFPVVAFMLQSCGFGLHDVGQPPLIAEPAKVVLAKQQVPMHVISAPRVSTRKTMSNTSLWNFKNGIYFRDTRAFEVGDVLTVDIVMNDSARFDNSTERETSVSGSLSGDGTYTLSNGYNPTITGAGKLKLGGSAGRGGTVNRTEKLQLSIAATVLQTTDNGNLHIYGTQEVRVNHELRVLTVEGIARASDIRSDNTISYDKIAEARISYGGGNTRKRRSIFARPHHRNHSQLNGAL